MCDNFFGEASLALQQAILLHGRVSKSAETAG